MILEWGTTTIVRIAVSRIVVVAVARVCIATAIIVVATTFDPVVGRVGLFDSSL